MTDVLFAALSYQTLVVWWTIRSVRFTEGLPI